mmetsp:Transcript_3025/g.4936  ORF Transcript_3025/g.4936 Transcript_3025/m.4936 type:complete len:478 (+) Transcript_3025:63-1496(+)
MGNKPSTPEEKHKRDLKERGVLIPPVFGVGNSTDHSSWEAFDPSLFTRLKQDSLTYRLLHQHLHRGVWISSQTNPGGSVLASLVPLVPTLLQGNNTNSSTTPSGNYISRNAWSEQQGMLRVSQQMGDKLAVQLLYHSHQSPNITTTLRLAPNVKLCSSLDAQGIGWWSAQYQTSVRNFFLPPPPDDDSLSSGNYYRNNPFANRAESNNDGSNRRLQLHFGSWLDIDASKNKNWSSKPTTTTTIGESLLSSIPAVHAYASLQVPGCLLAIQGKLPTTNNRSSYYETWPELSYHVSCDLTSNNVSNSNGSSSSIPPLVVTIRKSGQSSSSSMALSQVLTWDRYSVNALEDRCPKIRNSLAWTVALEKESSSTAAKPKAAMAWQINRGVALKVVAQPDDGIRGAIVLKRWKQPRITCACLVGTGQFGGLEFQGLGVTLEIGGADSNDQHAAAQQDVEYNDSQATIIVSPFTPETKVTLPK